MKTVNVFLKLFILILCSSLLLTACKKPDSAKQRAMLAAKADGPIEIGIAWPFTPSLKGLLRGADLAVKQLNAKGGVNGRPLKLIKMDDKSETVTGLIVAKTLSDDPNVVAVIGHYNSYVSMPASAIYQFGGMLMLNPGSTTMQLTRQNYPMVFRLIPNNRMQGLALAEYAKQAGYQRIIIFYEKGEYGRDLANYFERRARQLHLNIVDRMPYDKNTQQFHDLLSDWHQLLNFDAIFLAGGMPDVALIISQARAVGITKQFFGGDGLDTKALIEQGGKAVEGTIVLSAFSNQSKTPAVVNFVKDYQQAYQQKPDTWSALGYDSVMLLATAMTKAKSTVPAKVAIALRTIRNWPGTTGTHSFADDGDLAKPSFTIKKVKQGQLIEHAQH